MFLYQQFSKSMQKYVRGLVFLFLVGLVASSFAFAYSHVIAARVSMKNYAPTRTVAVSGEGKVSVKPDTATVRATVVTSAVKVGDAQAENSRKSNKVMDFLKNKGIEERDIKTVGYGISPQYDYNAPCPTVLGGAPVRCSSSVPHIASYEVRHTMEIKVRDLAKADDVLAGVVANGANEVDGLQFGIDDEGGAKAAARKIAIDDAQKKANVLARDLGVRFRRIVSFSESGQGGGPIFYGAKGMAMESVAAPSPQVAPGEQEIVSQVTITYEFQ